MLSNSCLKCIALIFFSLQIKNWLEQWVDGVRHSGWCVTKMAAASNISFQAQSFDSFLVLDFEATCDNEARINPQEIIEFPCLKVNGKTFEVEAIFHHYIKPRFLPTLTAFCTKLTGITQEMVEDQAHFENVFDDFQAWLKNEKIADSSFAFVTCGDWDLKTMLPNQCRQVGLETPELCKEWINIKKSYNSVMKSYPKHLTAMLKGMGMSFEGRPHSGIDDCKNIARVLKALAQRDFVFRLTWKNKQARRF